MRTLESYEHELNQLRERHSVLFTQGKFPEMQRCGEKTIALLDAITRHFPQWREKSNSSYRILGKDERILPGDEVCLPDEHAEWQPTRCVGRLAPDPGFPAHCIYRRRNEDT